MPGRMLENNVREDLVNKKMRGTSSKVTKIIRRAKFKIRANYSDYSVNCKYILSKWLPQVIK